MHVEVLDHARLSEAALVLADACPFDRATDVAEEKLFGAAPLPAPLGPVLAPPGAGTDHPDVVRSAAGASPPALAIPTNMPWLYPAAFGVVDGNELVGVAAVCSRWLRVLAVVPRARHRGAGTLLLDACIAHARSCGETRMRALDQPGNYLAPGVDARNTDAIAWLEKRGFVRGEPRTNVLVAVRDNPRVSSERADAAAAAARALGYEVRRARPDERELIAAVRTDFGGAWPWELECALGMRDRPADSVEREPAAHEPGVHVATKDGAYCAFAAHDGNNRGLGWFGPTGTWPSHRGKGLGEALLLACLVDVAREHSRCEVAWIGPRPFYDRVAGIVEDRLFVSLARDIA